MSVQIHALHLIHLFGQTCYKQNTDTALISGTNLDTKLSIIYYSSKGQKIEISLPFKHNAAFLNSRHQLMIFLLINKHELGIFISNVFVEISNRSMTLPVAIARQTGYEYRYTSFKLYCYTCSEYRAFIYLQNIDTFTYL